MSLMIELNKLISRMEINNVMLKSSKVEVLAHPLMITTNNSIIAIEEKVGWQLTDKKNILMCDVDRTLVVELDMENNQKLEAVTIQINFRIQYVVNGEDVIDENILKIFCETNAVYNSYPYFREYVHSTSVRIGIEPVVLPFLKPMTVKQIQEKFGELKAPELPSSGHSAQ